MLIHLPYLPSSLSQRGSPPSPERPSPPHASHPPLRLPHAENPTDPFEFVPSPDRIESRNNKSTGISSSPLKKRQLPSICSEDTADHFSTKGGVKASLRTSNNCQLKAEQTRTSRTLCSSYSRISRPCRPADSRARRGRCSLASTAQRQCGCGGCMGYWDHRSTSYKIQSCLGHR